MAVNRLKPPRNLRIEFKPSPRQYELWKLLQPNYCPHCGGEIEQILIGYDQQGNPQYRPQCRHCKSQNLPQLILGGGAAGGGKSYIGSVWLVSSCIRFENIRAVVARKTLKSLKESTWNTIKSILKDWGLKEYGLHLDAYGGRTDQCRVGPHTIIPVSILYLDIQPVVVQV